MSTTGPVAGWYADPYDATQQRYWDGVRWSEHHAPYAVAPVVPTQSGMPYGHVAATSTTATTALVLGILSLVFLGFFSGIPAMVIARRATREIDASRGEIGGRGVATAGFVTGLIGTLWSGLVLVLVLFLVFVGLTLEATP